jgi:pyruvate dehydrogenase E1 component alpha subunit
MPAKLLDGSDILEVWQSVEKAIEHCRTGKGPFYLHMECYRPEGHFLGDPLIRVARNPLGEMKKLSGPLLKSTLKTKGASGKERSKSLGNVVGAISKTMKNQLLIQKDPLQNMLDKNFIDQEKAKQVEVEESTFIEDLMNKVDRIVNEKGGADDV